MIQTTLGIIVKSEQILLCMKKRGLGEGLLNGPGGKVEKGVNMRKLNNKT